MRCVLLGEAKAVQVLGNTEMVPALIMLVSALTARVTMTLLVLAQTLSSGPVNRSAQWEPKSRPMAVASFSTSSHAAPESRVLSVSN